MTTPTIVTFDEWWKEYMGTGWERLTTEPTQLKAVAKDTWTAAQQSNPEQQQATEKAVKQTDVLGLPLDAVYGTHQAAEVASELLERGLFDKSLCVDFRVKQQENHYFLFVVADSNREVLAEIVKKVRRRNQWA